MECNDTAMAVATSEGMVPEKNGLEVVWIRAEALKENPDNVEVVGDVEELVLSIKQNGFTNPINVTDFGTEEGVFMIVSGHRRFKAGKECGMKSFPCIVWHYDSKAGMLNDMLLSQSSKDTAKDPLLIQRRCRANKAYLELTGYQGSIREEIARRLGLTTRQVDRYLKLDKVIDPILEMVEDGTAGLTVSTVDPVGTLSPKGQEAILEQMRDAAGRSEKLTRARVADMVRSYKEVKAQHEKRFNEDGIDEDELFEGSLGYDEEDMGEDSLGYDEEDMGEPEGVYRDYDGEGWNGYQDANERDAYDDAYCEEYFDDAEECADEVVDERFNRLYEHLVELKELLGDGRYVPDDTEAAGRLLEIMRDVSGRIMTNIKCLC